MAAGKKELSPVFLLGCVFVVLAAFLRPETAVVPLNDDWSYLIPTFRLAEEGVLRVTGDSPTTHILHVFVGAAWLKLFGGGIGGLKFLTFLWYFAGALLLGRLLLEEKVDPVTTRIATLTYVFNPILLILSVSFMTDIPYITLTIAALYAYLRGMREERDGWFLTGSIAAAGAYLIKQLGLFLPVAMILVLWRMDRAQWRRVCLVAAPVLLAVTGHQFWFHFLHEPTWAGTADGVYLRALRLLSEPATLVRDVSRHTVGMIFHLSLFLMPLLVGWARGFRLKPFHALFAVPAFFVVARVGKFPYLENTFYYTGIGTPTVVGTDWKTAGVFGWPWFWEAVTAAAFLGGLLLLTKIVAAVRRSGDRPAVLLLACCAAFQFGVPLLTTKYMDRYTLYGLPALIGLLSLTAVRSSFQFRRAAAALAAAAVIYVSATGDYVAWNNAKWKLARRGMELGMAPESIVGGHDWDMYWTFESKMAELKKIKPLKDIRQWEWLETLPREAIISFVPPKYWRGPPPLLEETYDTPLGSGTGVLYLYAIGARNRRSRLREKPPSGFQPT